MLPQSAKCPERRSCIDFLRCATCSSCFCGIGWLWLLFPFSSPLPEAACVYTTESKAESISGNLMKRTSPHLLTMAVAPECRESKPNRDNVSVNVKCSFSGLAGFLFFVFQYSDIRCLHSRAFFFLLFFFLHSLHSVWFLHISFFAPSSAFQQAVEASHFSCMAGFRFAWSPSATSPTPLPSTSAALLSYAISWRF